MTLLAGALSAIVLSSIAFLIYWLTVYVYRITFHPLARFPGPRLAGLTYWYECYYDVFHNGKYIFKLEELHKQYGPILRVNPNEVHIADSDFYSEIYHQKSYKTDRDTWYNLEFLGEGLAFTMSHDIHARRRAALSNYFSAKSIRALEGRITPVVAGMAKHLSEAREQAQILDLRHLYSALSMDIASEYSFGKSGSTNYMSNPNLGKEWVVLTESQLPLNPFGRHFKTIFKGVTNLPDWVAVHMAPFIVGFIKWQASLMTRIHHELQNKDNTEKGKELSVIHELIMNPDLPPREKRPSRLKDEASLLLGAGGETTASALARTTFYILSTPDVLHRLKQELTAAMPDSNQIPTLDGIAQLPYLNAVVEEGLRISMPVPTRSPRIFQDHPLVYGDWTIPPGMAISQSPYFVQTDTKIFPEPYLFRPERWINNPGLAKYQVAFSKGRRMCLGVNLAYAEMRLAIATIFRKYELQLYETTSKDVVMAHDYFLSFPEAGTKGVRVKVVGKIE